MSQRKGYCNQEDQPQLGCRSHLRWAAGPLPRWCTVCSAGDRSQIPPWAREGGLTEVRGSREGLGGTGQGAAQSPSWGFVPRIPLTPVATSLRTALGPAGCGSRQLTSCTSSRLHVWRHHVGGLNLAVMEGLRHKSVSARHWGSPLHPSSHLHPVPVF